MSIKRQILNKEPGHLAGFHGQTILLLDLEPDLIPILVRGGDQPAKVMGDFKLECHTL